MTIASIRKQHCIIYIPGLGDRRTRGQALALRLWRRRGINPVMFAMHWDDGEPYQAKFTRLLALIDERLKAGDRLSLVAASAGGSVALNAFVVRQQQITGLVGICPKFDGYSSVNTRLYQKNSAFKTAMQQLPESRDLLTTKSRHRILSLHPLADDAVPRRDTLIDGAASRTMPVIGHTAGIAYGLTLGSFGIISFLRKMAAAGR